MIACAVALSKRWRKRRMAAALLRVLSSSAQRWIGSSLGGLDGIKVGGLVTEHRQAVHCSAG